MAGYGPGRGSRILFMMCLIGQGRDALANTRPEALSLTFTELPFCLLSSFLPFCLVPFCFVMSYFLTP